MTSLMCSHTTCINIWSGSTWRCVVHTWIQLSFTLQKLQYQDSVPIKCQGNSLLSRRLDAASLCVSWQVILLTVFTLLVIYRQLGFVTPPHLYLCSAYASRQDFYGPPLAHHMILLLGALLSPLVAIFACSLAGSAVFCQLIVIAGINVGRWT
jgi:hypothetical protein